MAIIPSEINVALLSGGDSGEREISLASGRSAAEALKEAGFNVTMLDPANKEDLKRLFDDEFDVAFLCMHGRNGEDGTLQGLLELAGIPYTGPGVWASATAMNKAKAKIHYKHAGIPTPFDITLHSRDEMSASELHEKLGKKIVIKPASEGSALGVTISEDEETTAQAIESAFSIDDSVVVEQFIAGTELTVAVLGNEDAYALPIIEIVPQKNTFYDFESKYAAGGSDHICPARIDEDITDKIQRIAEAAHKALDCSCMSRTDFILDEEGNPWVLETNTIPGMTATSLLPDAARVSGLDFPALCTKLIEYAMEA